MICHGCYFEKQKQRLGKRLLVIRSENYPSAALYELDAVPSSGQNVVAWDGRAVDFIAYLPTLEHSCQDASKLLGMIRARVACVIAGKQGIGTLGPVLGWLDELNL